MQNGRLAHMVEQPPTQVREDRFRLHIAGYLSILEAAIYVLLGTLLSAAALLGILGAIHILLIGIRDWSGTAAIFGLIDRLLFVLMLVEILHTVRISIRSHILVVEPFLIVGLIASIRRMLVLTLQAEGFTNSEKWSQGGKQLFQASMIELVVFALLIAVLVLSIRTMRKTRSPESEETLAAFLPEDGSTS